jgi:YgiT-type zinc finger domain-containing protein
MKCVICHSEDIEKRLVEEEIKQGKDIYLFEVEAWECNACRERYYDDDTMKEIEDFREKLNKQNVDKEKVGEIYQTKSA